MPIRSIKLLLLCWLLPGFVPVKECGLYSHEATLSSLLTSAHSEREAAFGHTRSYVYIAHAVRGTRRTKAKATIDEEEEDDNSTSGSKRSKSNSGQLVFTHRLTTVPASRIYVTGEFASRAGWCGRKYPPPCRMHVLHQVFLI